MINKKFNYKFSIILTLAIIIIFITVFANYLAPFNPDYQNYEAISQAPNSINLMGTDYVGRDIFSRILYGGRYSYCSISNFACCFYRNCNRTDIWLLRGNS